MMRGSRLVAACMILLFEASRRKARATLIIEHKGHEGSHAVCETLGKFCFFPDCSEGQDAAFNNNQTDWKSIHAQNVTLTRFEDPERDVASLRDDDVVLILVRLDLMRWTLSLYYKLNEGRVDQQLRALYKDPQFYNDRSALRAIPPQHHDVQIVHDTALQNTYAWRHKLTVLDLLRRRNTTRYAILTYEEFCDGGEAYLEKVLAKVGVEPPCRLDKDVTLHTEKVHSTDLHDFVSNYEEVYQHFIYTSYPTWGELAIEHRDVHV